MNVVTPPSGSPAIERTAQEFGPSRLQNAAKWTLWATQKCFEYKKPIAIAVGMVATGGVVASCFGFPIATSVVSFLGTPLIANTAAIAWKSAFDASHEEQLKTGKKTEETEKSGNFASMAIIFNLLSFIHSPSLKSLSSNLTTLSDIQNKEEIKAKTSDLKFLTEFLNKHPEQKENLLKLALPEEIEPLKKLLSVQ
ncbi:MAG: hypothetical protein A2007_01250 [Verrucomicrobia bacterium GWC2_42_7]|nr:MAG: hypothetical protein A2007_01250 [Verrucomicrobia bacterium GWC2_42_7]